VDAIDWPGGFCRRDIGWRAKGVSAGRAPLDYPHSDGPAPGTTRAIAPGVRWVRMAVPFPPEHINLWLVDDGAGWAIVDCGLGLDETRAAWEQVFAHELDGRPITRVIVTHFHPDHLGLGTWLMARWGVDAWMTEGEWMTARGVHAVTSDGDLEIKIGALPAQRRSRRPARGLSHATQRLLSQDGAGRAGALRAHPRRRAAAHRCS
jgi:glyoxylase-like metal-dependent hydrolase (beta-lactamase superfamily II)